MFEKYGEIMTIDEVCEVLLVGRGRVYQLLRNKEIPSFRIGEVWKIPKKGIEEYIISQSGIGKKQKNDK